MQNNFESLSEIALTHVRGGFGPVPEPVGPTGRTVFTVPGTNVFTTNPGLHRQYNPVGGAGPISPAAVSRLQSYNRANGF